jgi:hypothetical protein
MTTPLKANRAGYYKIRRVTYQSKPPDGGDLMGMLSNEKQEFLEHNGLDLQYIKMFGEFGAREDPGHLSPVYDPEKAFRAVASDWYKDTRKEITLGVDFKQKYLFDARWLNPSL